MSTYRFPLTPHFRWPTAGSLSALLAFGLAAQAPSGFAAMHSAAGVSARADAAAFGKLPLSFEANQGQTDPAVKFLARGEGYALFLTSSQAVLELKPSGASVRSAGYDNLDPLGKAHPGAPSILSMTLGGAHDGISVEGESAAAGATNYLIGNDPKRWHTGIKSYGRVKYHGVYPGIDLVFYGNQRQLEYDFVIAPNADPSKIALSFSGARPAVENNGDLLLPVNGDEVRFHKPVVYQMDGGTRKAVDAGYVVAGGEARFRLGAYDRSKPLVIDPVLSYLTYLGGSSDDYIGNSSSQATSGEFQGQGIAVDSQGSAYLAGSTYSTDFPTQSPFQAAGVQKDGQPTAFVTKLNPTGTAFVYSTYLGGTVIDIAHAIAVDAAGSAYVTGRTQSPDFPVTTGAFQTVCAPELTTINGEGPFTVTSCGWEANANAFLTKLSPDGSSLVYSSFLGGNNALGSDGATAVAVDGKGQAYVTGSSADPCHPGYPLGGVNGVTYYEPTFYCFPTTTGALVSGSANDSGSGYVDYTTTPASTPDPTNEEAPVGFLSVFSADGSSLIYSTLLSTPVEGGYGFYGTAIALDPAGNVYIGGGTQSGNLSTTPGAFQTTTGPATNGVPLPLINLPEVRGFVAKFGPVDTGSAATLTYLSYLGGSTTNSSDNLGGIVADSAGNAYVSGYTGERDFPVTAGAYQTVCASDQPADSRTCSAAFVTKIKPDGSGLVWSTYVGNLTSSSPIAYGGPLAIDASGNVYLVGTAYNTFPQVNPIQTNTGGNGQAFVSKLDPTGSTLLFSTLVGSGGTIGSQSSSGLALDSQGNIYLAGLSYAANALHTTAGAAQPSAGDAAHYDGFIAKIAPFASSTTSLAASPASVAAGTAVTVTSVVTGAGGGSIPTGTVSFQNAGTAVGSATLDATGTATANLTLAAGSYSLVAVYSGDTSYSGSSSAAQPVTVTAPAPTVSLAVSPSTLVLGASATLTWSSTDSTSCTASGSWSGDEATNGSQSVTPAAAGTETYTLNCTGPGGNGSNTASLTVTAPPPPPPTVSIAVSPSSITLGSSATITWSSTNATACTASGGWSGSEATSGSQSVTPTATGSFTETLSCSGDGGTTSNSATLTVKAAGHHGGGSIGLWTSLPLLLLRLVRRKAG